MRSGSAGDECRTSSTPAIRCTVLYGHDDVLEIGRKLRARNGAKVPQIFVRREMLLCPERETHRSQQNYRCTKCAFHFNLLLLWLKRKLWTVKRPENVPCSA